jgi:hypothetical protein
MRHMREWRSRLRPLQHLKARDPGVEAAAAVVEDVVVEEVVEEVLETCSCPRPCHCF